jgi:hypothetical protein
VVFLLSVVYGGNPLAYDFEAELTKARERERIQERAKVRRARETERIFWLREFPTAPTPEALRRHAERFGKEGVQEIADLYGVDLEARTEVRRPRRLTSGQSARRTTRAREAIKT